MTISQTQDRSDDQRYQRILALAEELVYSNGFYKLSLSELTDRLKISRSTIYDYFGSKEGLIAVIVDRLTQNLNRSLDIVLENEELNIREKFIYLAQLQSKFLNGRNDHRLIRDLKLHLPHLFEKFEAGRKHRITHGYSVLVQEGINAQIFDSSLPRDFLLQLYLKMGQLVSDTDLLENTSMNKSDAMEIIMRIYLNGTKNISL